MGHDLPSWPIAPNDRLGVELSRSAIAIRMGTTQKSGNSC